MGPFCIQDYRQPINASCSPSEIAAWDSFTHCEEENQLRTYTLKMIASSWPFGVNDCCWSSFTERSWRVGAPDTLSNNLNVRPTSTVTSLEIDPICSSPLFHGREPSHPPFTFRLLTCGIGYLPASTWETRVSVFRWGHFEEDYAGTIWRWVSGHEILGTRHWVGSLAAWRVMPWCGGAACGAACVSGAWML